MGLFVYLLVIYVILKGNLVSRNMGKAKSFTTLNVYNSPTSCHSRQPLLSVSWHHITGDITSSTLFVLAFVSFAPMNHLFCVPLVSTGKSLEHIKLVVADLSWKACVCNAHYME